LQAQDRQVVQVDFLVAAAAPRRDVLGTML
jgi:hypothetical protein